MSSKRVGRQDHLVGPALWQVDSWVHYGQPDIILCEDGDLVETVLSCENNIKLLFTNLN